MTKEEVKISVAGDSAVFIELPAKISPDINRKIHLLSSAIEKKKIEGVVEVVPTYRSLCIYYNPVEIELEKLLIKVDATMSSVKDEETRSSKEVEIPVVYGGEYGPDLDSVAKYNHLSPEEVIKIHSGKKYLVYMFGFCPGYPYLGGMDERIATPRLKTPRTKVPAGSVAIAETQAGIYPIESPGGWRLIGRTPIKLFDPTEAPPVPFLPGDYIKFVPVSEQEYLDYKNKNK